MASKLTSIAVVTALASVGVAQERIETELTLDFASKYVWHGLNLVNDPVLQPNLAFTYGRFSVSFWGNLELTGWNEPNFDRHPRGRFTEVDTTLEYSGSWAKGSWNVGVVEYQYPGTGFERYQEWFAGLACDATWGSPEITLYKGSKARTGAYATLGVSHSVPLKLSCTETLDLGAELSFGDSKCNDFLYGHDRAGFTDVHLTAGAEFALGKGWSLTPSLHYSTLLSKRLLEGEPRRTNVWLQVGLGTKF